ncbi:LuxR C-terminal-related transcriptional regulator [Pseudorhodoferax sp. Leaf265]|uniref:helix-turn-helix transcriptional regulator n=1 Tax=Pseudorhodoferax sp. Leaf265 TaxID=1736315 RepID=UPI0006FCB5FA|nr:LuxR C-terminal-related transcriptional regulator [Pseudorhodoferax sp. Leaf265]KQP18768.1 hypothetical protein ASF45_26470 [Pseudorhodoferax sp. Leaf265]
MQLHEKPDCLEFATRTAEFAKTMLECPACVFTWIDDSQPIPPCVDAGLGRDMIRSYYDVFRDVDPIAPEFLLSQRIEVTTLRSVADQRFGTRFVPYAQFMARFNFVDDAAFVFRAAGRPIAFLNVLRRHDSQDLFSEHTLRQLHGYIETSLLNLRSLRTFQMQERWATEFRLTAREMDVAALVATGLSNKEIAAHSHIEIVTVKTHVANVLAKLGLESRTQIASFA